jgi:uncharacterized protein with HEPN domain
MQRDETYLLDILLAARRIEEYTRNTTGNEFDQNNLLQDAVIRQFQVIGEAARLVSQEYKEAHLEIPGRQMVGMRHRLIHQYFVSSQYFGAENFRSLNPGHFPAQHKLRKFPPVF